MDGEHLYGLEVAQSNGRQLDWQIWVLDAIIFDHCMRIHWVFHMHDTWVMTSIDIGCRQSAMAIM